jgi:hypothetical protein
MFAKPTVQGNNMVLEYLGRYVHRTAMSERALIASDERTVAFGYRDSRDHQRKIMILPAHEFLRRFLQHVPPKGFHRVRAFGLLHAEHRDTLRRLQLLLAPQRTAKPMLPDQDPSLPTKSRSRLVCPHCGQPSLRLVRRLCAAECMALDSVVQGAVTHVARAPPVPRNVITGLAYP